MIQKGLIEYCVKEINEKYNDSVKISIMNIEKAKEDFYNLYLIITIDYIGTNRLNIKNLDMSLSSGDFYKEWIYFEIKKRIENILKEYIGGDEE